jgi:hypothetical protein
MTDSLSALGERLRHLEEEVEVELKRRRSALHADFEARRVRFEAEVLAAQRRLKQGLLYYLWDSSILAIVTAPVIYAGILPLTLLHVFLWIYQTICFPVYGIQKVRQRDCFVFDRHHLGYLNIIEKFNCAYCSYGSGVAAYFARSSPAPSSTGAPSSTPGGVSTPIPTTKASRTSAMRRPSGANSSSYAGSCRSTARRTAMRMATRLPPVQNLTCAHTPSSWVLVVVTLSASLSDL